MPVIALIAVLGDVDEGFYESPSHIFQNTVIYDHYLSLENCGILSQEK